MEFNMLPDLMCICNDQSKHTELWRFVWNWAFIWVFFQNWPSNVAQQWHNNDENGVNWWQAFALSTCNIPVPSVWSGPDSLALLERSESVCVGVRGECRIKPLWKSAGHPNLRPSNFRPESLVGYCALMQIGVPSIFWLSLSLKIRRGARQKKTPNTFTYLNSVWSVHSLILSTPNLLAVIGRMEEMWGGGEVFWSVLESVPSFPS